MIRFSPLNLLDIISAIVLIFSYAGLLVAIFFRASKEIKVLLLSMVLGLAPALFLTQTFAPFYQPVISFLIYYPCFTLIIWGSLPYFLSLFGSTHTHSHTHTPSNTQFEDEDMEDYDQDSSINGGTTREQKFGTSERERERENT